MLEEENQMAHHNAKVLDPVTGRKITNFQSKWGVHANDLALSEGTTPAAIHMRVRNFGTPWQRRARPTAAEIITGLTRKSIARKVGIHYNYVGQKLLTREGTHDLLHRLDHHKEKYSTIDTDKEAWLMPQHPNYTTWRYTEIIKLLENTYGTL